MMYRQGDVLIRKIDKKESGRPLEANEHGFITFVRGEGKFHDHGVDKANAKLAQFIRHENGIDIYQVEVTESTDFKHIDNRTQELSQEHDCITLEPGLYEIRSQREGVGELVGQRGNGTFSPYQRVID